MDKANLISKAKRNHQLITVISIMLHHGRPAALQLLPSLFATEAIPLSSASSSARLQPKNWGPTQKLHSVDLPFSSQQLNLKSCILSELHLSSTR